jgi:CHAT domain-containing protein
VRLQTRIAFLICALAFLGFAGGAAAQTADDYLGRGENAYRLGDLGEAVRQWNQAIGICDITGDVATASNALGRRGEVLGAMGFQSRGIADLAKSLEDAEAVHDDARIAAAAGALGNAYFHAREFVRAQDLLERSLRIARERQLDAVRAATANNLGNLIAAAEKDPDAASALYDEASRYAELSGEGALVATVKTNKARLLLASRADDPAVPALLDAASERLLREPPSHARTLAEIAAGRLAAGGAGPELSALSYRLLRQAVLDAGTTHDERTLSLAYGYLGELYLANKRPADAQVLLQRAIFAAQQADASDIGFRWEWGSGRILAAAGDIDAAIAAYRRAVGELEAIRQDIPIEYLNGRSSFRENIGPIYYQLADLLLRRSGAPEPTRETQQLLGEARDTIETLKTAELRDYFHDRCIIDLEAKQKAIDIVGIRTAAIYPIILPDRLELLVTLGKEERRITVAVDEPRLTAEIRRFRELLEKRGTNEYRGPARQLYDWIVRPLESELARAGVDTLVFIPDGPLRTIPMAALYDGKDFLVARYSVVVTPGLTLVDPKPLKPPQDRLALYAGISESVQGFAALPSVKTEIDSASRVQPGKILENADFQTGSIGQQLKDVPYSIVHIASHAEFTGDPDQSFLLTYNGKLTLDQLEGAVKLGKYREDALELLVLSACTTAAGDDRAALGLAGIAIKAGARAAVASLWYVNDQATAALIGRFYQGISEAGLSKAEALRRAQIALMADPRFRHPAYWSGFLLIGDWL